MDWAKRYGEIIESGGVLIALIFPIDGAREGGPPYSMSLTLYDQLLGEWFDRVYCKEPSKPKVKAGQELITVWVRK